jgi:hypothetical protein
MIHSIQLRCNNIANGTQYPIMMQSHRKYYTVSNYDTTTSQMINSMQLHRESYTVYNYDTTTSQILNSVQLRCTHIANYTQLLIMMQLYPK